MAGLIIDEFSAKPAGFLAKWRYRRVLINTEAPYIVSSICVIGNECLSLPNLSSYQKVSRRFKAGDVITTFCDFVTFKRVTVVATDVEPFAEILPPEIDVPACGYNASLPTPAVPPNPWNTVTYGLLKTYEFCDKTDNYLYQILIYKKFYTGSPSAISSSGASPVTMSYKRDADDKFSPIVGCQVSITFQATATFDISELYTDDEREFKVVINRNGVLYFSGFIVPDIAKEPFKAYPYDVTITVTDGLALLKKQSYPIPVSGSVIVRQRFIDILAFCFSQTGLQLDIFTICNLYEQKMANGPDDDPMSQAKVNPLRFADDKGNIGDCYFALTEVAKLFGAFICQLNGVWQFVRVNELSGLVIRGRRYNYTALFLFSTQYAPYRTISHTPGDVEQINANAVKYRTAAYKYVKVLMKYGFVPSTLLNGDFELWDGFNFTYWTTFGGLSFSRIQKSVLGANNQPFLLDDYCLQFNEVFNPFKSYRAFPMSANKDYTVAFTLNVGSNGGRDVLYFRMHMGEYWLKNSDAQSVLAQQQNGTLNIATTGQYEWVKTGLATCTFITEFGTKDINAYQLQLEIPPLPAFGELEVFLMGFRTFNVAAQLTNGVVTELLTPRTYAPVQVDNVTLSISKNPSENTPDGILYKSLQDKNYTSSDEKEILFGDYSESQTAISNAVYNPLKNLLHPIFTSDNSYSSLWYEYGASSTKLAIGAWLAKGILKAYQRTLTTIDLDLLGLDINILNVFGVCSIDGKQFMVLTGDLELKSNQFKNVTLVEIFDKNVQTQDNSVINSPALKYADIPQDPAVVGYFDPEDDDRIFYPQFGPEFT